MARVKQTIAKRDWYKNFSYKLFSPDGFNLDSKNLSGLKKQIEKEFVPEKMKRLGKAINDYWLKNSELIDKFLKSVPYDVPDSLIVKLTRYGVGGSYWLPNNIIINVSCSSSAYRHFRTLMHEFVHLLIEKPVIQKNKLRHESKEALVDFIMTNNQYLKKMFKNYKIQKPFARYLPDKKLLANFNEFSF